MKRSPRRKPATPKAEPSSDQILQFLGCLEEAHQLSWHAELVSSAPYWEYLVALHLRMVELEHTESAAQELL
jgi:hypothetical protein